jgi:hypothetical protein
MATYTMTLRPGTYPEAVQDQADKVTCLKRGDVLAVTMADFNDACRMDAIKFYVTEAEEAADRQFGAWTYGFGPQYIAYAKDNKTTNLFHVVWQSKTQVYITNTADLNSAEQHAWFKVEVLDTGSKERWELDPEVINTGGGDTRAGFYAPTTGDTTQTLGV